MRTTDRQKFRIAPALLFFAIALLQTVPEMRSAARFVARSARCLLWVALVLSVPTSALSADKKVPEKTMLIMNVKIFDGTSEKLITGKDVTIKGNKIDKLVDAGGDGSVYDQVIDGGGRILMPGLIESHAHLTWAAIPMADLKNSLPSYEQVVATVLAKNMLMRGITSVRDMGGPVFGLKRAIDEGIVPGPRIYPSGTFVSQTSGHGDFRQQNDQHAQFGGQRKRQSGFGFAGREGGLPAGQHGFVSCRIGALRQHGRSAFGAGIGAAQRQRHLAVGIGCGRQRHR